MDLVITDVRSTLGPRAWHFLHHSQAGLPGRFGSLPEDLNLTGAVMEKVRGWVRSFRDDIQEGTGLLIHGDPLDTNPLAGAAITWAVGASPRYFNDVRTMSGVAIPIRCASTSTYIDRLRGSYSGDEDDRDFVRSMKGLWDSGEAAKDLNVHLAALLDLGEEIRSDNSRNELRSLLRGRYERRLPTIVTTELDSGAIDREYSSAMTNLLGRAFVPINLRTGE